MTTTDLPGVTDMADAAFAAALETALRSGRDESAAHLALSRYTVEMQTRQTLELYRRVLAADAA